MIEIIFASILAIVTRPFYWLKNVVNAHMAYQRSLDGSKSFKNNSFFQTMVLRG